MRQGPDRDLAQELLAMAAEDEVVRAELVADGSLFEGYHSRMAEVHRRNAKRLDAIIDAHGWPGRVLVGEDASRAAFLVLQHAIGSPAVMRRGLPLVQAAAMDGDVDPVQVAMLEDRILSFEGKPQRYGTQFDWDEDGLLNPLPIADPADVDARRRAVRLDSLAENVARIRANALRDGHQRPDNAAARQEAAASWARSVGWRT